MLFIMFFVCKENNIQVKSDLSARRNRYDCFQTKFRCSVLFYCFPTVPIEGGVEDSGFDIMCSVSYGEGECPSHHHTASVGGGAQVDFCSISYIYESSF